MPKRQYEFWSAVTCHRLQGCDMSQHSMGGV
jgi:hypothetical protein